MYYYIIYQIRISEQTGKKAEIQTKRRGRKTERQNDRKVRKTTWTSVMYVTFSIKTKRRKRPQHKEQCCRQENRKI
jgi:hypothetical protein